MTDTQKDASKITIARNAAMAASLDWKDEHSFKDAQKGFIATLDPLTITDDNGKTVWNMVPYLESQAPGSSVPLTVNPSLWRQAHLNNFNGLFQVCEGIYQVRAFDISNMTIIEGTTGLIIIDPLISTECARSALKLYRDNREETAHLDVTAVIYTHSHVDHFGGVEGVLKDDEGNLLPVEIYAPDHFLEHAVSENIYAGCAMGRRAQFMYGPLLPKDDNSQVDTGLGKNQSKGTLSLYQPTVVITDDNLDQNIAGVQVTFHLTPGSEAPAEMDFYFPDFKAFCAAENATHNMHNIQTLRGANVRDALMWSKYLGDAVEMFGREAEVMFASHHWPIWGQPAIADFLGRQRDMYRYLNDQTLRMLNKGYTGIEIAEVFEMPEALATDWSCRGYYGSVSHNTKAVYDKYMGWFDGNPSNLHRLTPRDAAPRYVELMGGTEAVLRAARVAGEIGEYRWAAELIGHVVFADQSNQEAKDLQADMLEQMGYQAENATWRNFFLMGAQELRDGIDTPTPVTPSTTFVAAMTNDMLFDALAAKIIGPRVGAANIVMNWDFTDDPELIYRVWVQDGVLNYLKQDELDPQADVTIKLNRKTLNLLISGALALKTVIQENLITVTGDLTALLHFFCLLDGDDPSFPIVTPRTDAKTAWRGLDKLAELEGDAVALMDHPRVALPRVFIGDMPRGC